jgi:ABC-type glycerol-3-phosphate transport system permease component
LPPGGRGDVTLPVIAVFVAMQRQFIAGIATTGSKG